MFFDKLIAADTSSGAVPAFFETTPPGFHFLSEKFRALLRRLAPLQPFISAISFSFYNILTKHGSAKVQEAANFVKVVIIEGTGITGGSDV